MKQQRCESKQFISDNVERFARDFYIKRKEGEREQDNRETERERVCERGRALRVEEDSIGNKIDC